MRLPASRYAVPKPVTVKQAPSQLQHVSAPLKGLNLSSKLTVGDPLTAPILTNFVVEDDRIQCRAGTELVTTHADGQPVWALVPWYGGAAAKLAGASNGKLFDAVTGTNLKTGFTSNDWSWTAFANLAQAKYTVMVNGSDGVWSWDGSTTPDTSAGPVAVTNLSNANPAVVTVAAANIGKFANGQTVLIAGAAGTGMTAANGYHTIASVGTPANTFQLVGVDTSTGTAPQTVGVTADPITGGIIKELVTAPPANPWIVIDQMNIVLAHMNRLWFADTANLVVYYLPLQQKSGELKLLPLNAIFKRGGSIRAMYTWNIEGGQISLSNNLCIFTTNGELAIYAGTDPDTDFHLVGVYRFDPPMSKHSVVNYGGDLYVLISTGLVPMTTMMRAETEQLGNIDRAVISFFLGESIKYRDRGGWQTFLNPSSGRLFCNIPQGYSNRYTQMVRHMPRPVWSQFEDLPARCWGWIEPYVFFADDSGRVFRMHPDLLSDAGNPIRCDVQMAWSLYKTPGLKHFKMVRAYMPSDALVRPYIDIKVDYDLSPPENQPDVTFGVEGAVWDVAEWDVADWAGGTVTITQWTGVGRLGRVGAPRLTALIKDCKFAVAGFDVLYEAGAAI